MIVVTCSFGSVCFIFIEASESKGIVVERFSLSAGLSTELAKGKVAPLSADGTERNSFGLASLFWISLACPCSIGCV